MDPDDITYFLNGKELGKPTLTIPPIAGGEHCDGESKEGPHSAASTVHWTLGRTPLGEGAYGCVYSIVDQSKVAKLGRIYTTERLEEEHAKLKKEARLFCEVNGGQALLFFNSRKFTLILERMPGRTLGSFLYDRTIPYAEKLHVLDCVFSAVKAHLHDRNIFHGDLHLSNIMVNKEEGGSYNISFVDFGFACRWDEEVPIHPKGAHLHPDRKDKKRPDRACPYFDLYSLCNSLSRHFRPFFGELLTVGDPKTVLEIQARIRVELGEIDEERSNAEARALFCLAVIKPYLKELAVVKPYLNEPGEEFYIPELIAIGAFDVLCDLANEKAPPPMRITEADWAWLDRPFIQQNYIDQLVMFCEHSELVRRITQTLKEELSPKDFSSAEAQRILQEQIRERLTVVELRAEGLPEHLSRATDELLEAAIAHTSKHLPQVLAKEQRDLRHAIKVARYEQFRDFARRLNTNTHLLCLLFIMRKRQLKFLLSRSEELGSFASTLTEEEVNLIWEEHCAPLGQAYKLPTILSHLSALTAESEAVREEALHLTTLHFEPGERAEVVETISQKTEELRRAPEQREKLQRIIDANSDNRVLIQLVATNDEKGLGCWFADQDPSLGELTVTYWKTFVVELCIDEYEFSEKYQQAVSDYCVEMSENPEEPIVLTVAALRSRLPDYLKIAPDALLEQGLSCLKRGYFRALLHHIRSHPFLQAVLAISDQCLFTRILANLERFSFLAEASNEEEVLMFWRLNIYKPRMGLPQLISLINQLSILTKAEGIAERLTMVGVRHIPEEAMQVIVNEVLENARRYLCEIIRSAHEALEKTEGIPEEALRVTCDFYREAIARLPELPLSSLQALAEKIHLSLALLQISGDVDKHRLSEVNQVYILEHVALHSFASVCYLLTRGDHLGEEALFLRLFGHQISYELDLMLAPLLRVEEFAQYFKRLYGRGRDHCSSLLFASPPSKDEFHSIAKQYAEETLSEEDKATLDELLSSGLRHTL